MTAWIAGPPTFSREMTRKTRMGASATLADTWGITIAPHLFPDNFNRRGSPRVVLGIPVAYRFGNTIAAALRSIGTM